MADRRLFVVIAALNVLTAGMIVAPASAQRGMLGAEVSGAVNYGVSPALRDLPEATGPQMPQTIRRALPAVRPAGTGEIDSVLQSNAGPPLMPATVLNIEGVGAGFPGFTVPGAPSSTNIAVSSNYVVQVVNTSIAVFDKKGIVVIGPKLLNVIWTGFGRPSDCASHNDGDPIVQYDRIADRWLVSQFAFNIGAASYECVAVSKTSDPTGAYWLYAFQYNGLPDLPKIGVWPDAYYVTYNFFDEAAMMYLGVEVCALDRTHMLQGGVATQQCFLTSTEEFALLPADLDGSTLPPAGSPNYMVELGSAANTLAFWQFHVDWATPANSTFTGPTILATAPFANVFCSPFFDICVPQAGTTQKLDSIGNRLMYRLAYRNFGDHEALVTNHSVTAGPAVGVRWYEIRSPGTSAAIFQQGTYAPADGNYRWLGSLAMDQSGDMALGFSVSGAAIKPQIHYTGRLVGDPAGTMGQGEASIMDGAGVQKILNRWGDYTSMRIDPSDDCTFWYTNQYVEIDGEFNWQTRIASFRFPSCSAAVAPVFQSAASRKLHGTAGTFDLPLSP